MEYAFRDIEQRWKSYWKEKNVYKVSNPSPGSGQSDKPKFYILDMFPYPSGAGLHVGHPLGYIASDIYARYKRLRGYNVLHPMGFDAFGLPAEQYAIETGQHPANTTEQNIKRYKEQLDNIAFCYDWDREVRTSDPKYYKWTQWIFLQLFNSYYNRKTQKAESIELLIATFESEGNRHHPCPGDETINFTSEEWRSYDEKQQQDVLMQYRLCYSAHGIVNWCEALGTVLANDEVVNGVSERGGFPVVKKKLRQWYLRITEYADRLLEGLQKVDFSEAMKEMQGNWIGKSEGAEITFRLTPNPSPLGEGGGLSGRFFKTANTDQWKALKEFGRGNRKNKTEAEDSLWQRIRNNKLGVKVRRQHAVGGYIVDFAIMEKNLIIEIDGGYHNLEEQKVFDEARAGYLKELGLDIIRFTNEEVLNSIDSVVDKIKAEVVHRKSKSETGAGVPLLQEEKGTGDEAAITAYTTRPDTIFGVDFMVLAPEHELIEQITTEEQRQAVEEYIAYVKSRSERERMAEKKISGVFTGAYAVHPFNGKKIPVWIAEYVLAGYGTGAIMAVPCGDERDHKFAKHFNIPIANIIGDAYNGEEANPDKGAILENSDFINGMAMKEAAAVVVNKLEELGIGKRKVNYKLRDAAFSRQRYWGEPFPIVWKNGIAYPLDEAELPLELPHVESYKPGPEGEGPLANIPEWTAQNLETNTMPGYAGSSWYFLRYMDPHNDKEFASRLATDYWREVDIYIGGTEHAVGHLLYSRMWTKVLYDLGHIDFDEPFKKLINQGMIQGSSRFVYRLQGTNKFVSFGLKDTMPTDELHVDVNLVDGVDLDTKAFQNWRPEFADAEFILEGGKYICGTAIEKMSKSKYNVVNPDDIVAQYGSDTFRMYEMFLGPIEISKPWDTKGIEGVHRFLKKMWRLYFDEQKGFIVTEEPATEAEQRIIHKTIRKIGEDIERFSLNTAVSQFMICVNELSALNCHKREVLEKLAVLISPFAPHTAEELWHQLGHEGSVMDAAFPSFEERYVTENTKKYPVAVNGKTRVEMEFPLDASQDMVEKEVLADPMILKWLEGKAPKKVIYVKGRMINVVV